VELVREIPEIGDLVADRIAGEEPLAQTAVFITPHIVKPTETRQMAN
jgi:hypothetical protein